MILALVDEAVAAGVRLRAACEIIGLSVRAVEVNRAKLLEKLNLDTRPDLVRFAIANGVIDVNSADS